MVRRRGKTEGLEEEPQPAKPRRRRARKRDEGFYAEVMSEAERVRLPEARDVEGLDEEIALLRVRLASELERNPEGTTVFLRLVDRLVKAVALRYRLSGEAEGDLSKSIQGVLKGIGSSIFPEGYDGA